MGIESRLAHRRRPRVMASSREQAPGRCQPRDVTQGHLSASWRFAVTFMAASGRLRATSTLSQILYRWYK